MLKRIHSRKGFTLAELLIVVAIIAILVAIALPLFFGALDSAREATFQANKRAVKAAAIVAILENNDVANFFTTTDANKDNVIYATATVDDKTGDIEGAVTFADTATPAIDDYSDWITNDGKITVELKLTDVKAGA